MKIRFFRWYNVVLTALLAILGYGCSKDDYVCEYGTPNADYQLMGTVTDDAGKPVDGILVSIEEKYGDYWENLTSKKTEYGGSYHVYFNTWPESSSTKIIIQDIDGDANGGEFANDTIDIDYKSGKKVKEGGSWYAGAWQITQNIQLKKK